MLLYLLGFSTLDQLHHAFELVSDSQAVASCLVEPRERRIRFLVPEDEGEELVQHIYQLGGLSWCSRHRMQEARLRVVS